MSIYKYLFANAYDYLLKNIEEQILSPHRTEILKNVSFPSLEIGAGTGANLPFYSIETERKRVFLDYSPWMLRKLIQKDIKKIGVPILGQAEKLPFRNESFSAVVITLALCSIRSPGDSLLEIKRVIQPDGFLFLIDHVASHKKWKRWIESTLTPIWSHLADGCHLDRESDITLKQDFFPIKEYTFEYYGTTFIAGVYKKKGS